MRNVAKRQELIDCNKTMIIEG